MKKAIVRLAVDLEVVCPYCGFYNDLDSQDRDEFYLSCLFDAEKNGKLEGESVCCEKCRKEFEINEVAF